MQTSRDDNAFAAPLAATRVMPGYPHRWWFAGGSAIDLFVGRLTRKHGDLEIGLFREDPEGTTRVPLRRGVGRCRL